MAEFALSASDSLLKDLLESAPDAMLISDPAGLIVLSNSQAEQLFGHSKEKFRALRIEDLMPPRFREGHVRYRQGYFANPVVRPMGAALDLYAQHRDGSEFPVEISISPLTTPQGTYSIAAIRNVTERRRAEDKIRASLREKEVLLKEVHHRVKNNLQIISSIVNLQSQSIEDEHVRQLFNDMRSRVRSIALVHERLYESKNLVDIDFASYIGGLVNDIREVYGVDVSRIGFSIAIEDADMELDTVVNCGLIVNELVSNSIKYAFPEGRKGTISIGLRHADSKFVLTVADDGIGFAAPLDLAESKTLGLVLVDGLTRELGGTLAWSTEGGARFVIEIPESGTE